jgi:hypothetical protein
VAPPDRQSLTALLRESGWLMFTPVSGLTAHPLHAAVAHARFGVPDGYVAPHDSPAAYARAAEIEAARAMAPTHAERPAPADRGGHEV